MRKEHFIHQLFEGLAPRYDLFNRLSSLGLVSSWHTKLLAEAAFRPGSRVLDLCTGTGEIALRARRALKNGALVVGLDFSPSMLARARVKGLAQGLEASWVDGRAAVLPFQGGTFDGVTMGFAMRNMESVEATLREIHRVLKKGGRALILELGRPHHPVLRRLHRIWLVSFVKVIGVFLRGRKEPFDYLAASIYEFVEPGRFLEDLRKCGFCKVRYRPLQNGIAGIYVGVKDGT